MIRVRATWIFDLEHVRRWTDVFVDALPDTPDLMPRAISGRVELADGDTFLAQQAQERSLILNQTQVQYGVTAFDPETAEFQATKR